MVTEINPGPSINQAVGRGLQDVFTQQFEEQRNKQENMRKTNSLREALVNVQKVQANPNLSDEQKHIGLWNALSGHPELAKEITNQLQNQKKLQQTQEALQQNKTEKAAREERRIAESESKAKTQADQFQQQQDLRQKQLELARQKAEQPKAPPGGLTGQPVPPEISQKINEIISENPDANSDQLRIKMDEAGIPPTYSNPYTENRRRQDEMKSQVKEKRVEAGNKRAEKILEDADKIRNTIPLKRTSLIALEDAVQEGDMSFFSMDNLAEITGIEGFRTAKGGQFKTASKNFFINTLAKTGARPNMFLEKQIADGLPKIGRSREGNLIGVELAKFDIDYEAKRLETIDEISDQFMDTLGYVPGTFGKDIDKSMKTWVEERQQQLANRIKELNEQEVSKKKKPIQLSGKFIDVVGPDGQEYEIDQRELDQLPEGFKRK